MLRITRAPESRISPGSFNFRNRNAPRGRTFRFDPYILVRRLLCNARYLQWFAAAAKYRLKQVTVHFANELKDLLGANRLTLSMIGAAAKVFIHHRDHHTESPLIALGLTLRQRV